MESAEGSPAALAERSLTLRAALFLTGRIALMLAGIAVMGLGIDIVVKADLGNSPISATPNVLSIGFTMVSFGTFMLGWAVLSRAGANRPSSPGVPLGGLVADSHLGVLRRVH